MSECLLKTKLLIAVFHEDVMTNTSIIHHWAPLSSLYRAVKLRIISLVLKESFFSNLKLMTQNKMKKMVYRVCWESTSSCF